MSASPQVENGFVMIALDLFVALMTSDLPNGDMIVLTWVLLQSYGPNKRRDVHLDPATIEEYTGLHRNNVRASVKSLISAGYLRQNEDGSVRFVKTWNAYHPRGKPFIERLGGRLKKFAAASLTHFLFIKKPKKPTPPPDLTSTTATIQPDSPDSCKANPVELGSEASAPVNWIGTSAYAKPSEDDLTADVITTSESALTRAPARAEEELEIGNYERGKEGAPTRQPSEFKRGPYRQIVRSAEDLAEVEEAIQILAEEPRTEHVAMELSRQHNLRELVSIKGWQWIYAARKMTGDDVNESQRGSFGYMRGIASTTTRDEANGLGKRQRRPEQPSSSSRLPVIRAEHDPRRPPIRSKNAVQPTPAKEGA